MFPRVTRLVFLAMVGAAFASPAVDFHHPGGTYVITVDSVEYPGFVWDGITPANQYVKN